MNEIELSIWYGMDESIDFYLFTMLQKFCPFGEISLRSSSNKDQRKSIHENTIDAEVYDIVSYYFDTFNFNFVDYSFPKKDREIIFWHAVRKAQLCAC